MADHRINMTANFSQYDSAIKDAINNMRIFGNVANEGMQQGNAGTLKFFKSLNNLDSKAGTTRQRFVTMNTLLKEMEMQYNRLGDAAKKGAFGTELLSAIENARQKVEAYNKELQGVGVDMSSGGGKGKGLFGSILGGNLAARAVMDVLRFAKNTVKDAIEINKEFEYSNAELSAVLGKTKEEITDLTTQAKQLGATTLFTANEITNLQISLARLGFNKEEIKDSTEAISQLALATGVDLKDAATLTGSTLRAFGYNAKEAARVASVLGVSTTKSALDMEKLKTAMGYASSVARQAGFEIEDVVAMLGKMVDNGQQATTAGVNMRNIMLDLSDKSSKLSKAIKKVTGKDQITSFEEFIDALRQMREAGMNMDDVAKIIQRRVTPGFLNLIANTEGVSQLREELKDCNGELQNMADKMTNTLQGSITLFKSAWDGLMLSFSNSTGPIKEAIDSLTDLLNKMREARALENGGEDAISIYERGVNKKDYDNQTKWYDLQVSNKTKGIKDEKKLKQALLDANNEVYSAIADIIKDKSAKRDEFYKFYSAYKAAKDDTNMFNREAFITEWAPKVGDMFNKSYEKNIYGNIVGAARDFLLNEDENGFEKTILKMIANYRDQVATQQLIQSKYSDEIDAIITGNSSNLKGGKGILDDKDETKSALLGYEERIAKAYDNYALSLDNAAIEVKHGSMEEKEYLEKKLSATQQLYRAYVMVIAEIERELKKNPALKGELTPLLDQLKPQLAGYVNEMSELSTATGLLAEEQKKAAEKLKQDNATKAMDYKILRGLEGVANRAKTGWTPMGLNGIAERINLGVDIPDEEWEQLVNEQINPVLKGLNLDKIRIEFETGNIEKVKSDLEVFKTQLSSMQSVVSGLGSIKSAITDMMSAFEEGTEPFDAFLTVFSSGFQMIEGGIAIYEAFTKLQEISQLLTKAHTAAKIKDTVATNANTLAAGSNAISKKGEAVAAGKSGSMHMFDAASKAAGSVAWIPIVGGILAAAAVAALIASLVSAREESKNVGYMATGGIVEGNGMRPKGTDTVPTMLTPGEVVLNAAMSSNVASKLQGAGGQMVMVQGESRITGEEIKIVYNNYAKRRGLKTQLA